MTDSDARSTPERVPAATTERFAMRGLADVARRPGTVYRRFASKDDRIRATEQASRGPDVWAGFVHFVEQSTVRLATDRGLGELFLGGRTESNCSNRTIGSWART